MLTKEQETAVKHVYGPMMVVAGPGSGKTMVLTQRIKWLLDYTKPERILVITFAKKAAEEMQQRFAKLTDEETAEQVTFGTFHAVFYQWLREWNVVSRNVRVLDEEKRQQLWHEMGWDMEDIPAFLLCQRDAAMRYQQEKRRRNLIDFEDMVRLMEGEIKKHDIRQRYDFFLIDEFQDINPQQYGIVRQMVGKENPNLFIVGDEDQAIYAFRGSDPEIFLHFAKDFPGCKRVDLTLNFRCQGMIVEASKALICHNQKRFEKSIRAYKPKAETVKIKSVFDDKQEAMYIRDQVLKQKRHGFQYKEMAVLCRTNAQLRRVASALQEGGVPYECRESWNIDDKPEELLIKQDLELFWRLSRNMADREAFRGVLRTLPDLQEAENWRRVPEGCGILDGLLEQKMDAQLRREYEELKRRLEEGARLSQVKAYNYWMLQTDYLSYAYAKAKRRGLNKVDVWRQIRQMRREMKGEIGGVFLSTMHGAKGLEFDWVWIAGVNEGQSPRREAIIQGNLEEERRLLYVAMTRARKRLTLSYYDGLGMKPSRFLKEIKSLQTVF